MIYLWKVKQIQQEWNQRVQAEKPQKFINTFESGIKWNVDKEFTHDNQVGGFHTTHVDLVYGHL